MKLPGVCHYLTKPPNPDDIEAAFGLKEGDTEVNVTNRLSSLKTLEWERIHEVLAETGFNVSETATAFRRVLRPTEFGRSGSEKPLCRAAPAA